MKRTGFRSPRVLNSVLSRVLITYFWNIAKKCGKIS